MSTLFAALQSAGNALRVFEKNAGVVQNNVVNASTPGYARQQLELISSPWVPESGWYGGLETGQLQNSRNEFAEDSVRNEVGQYGYQAERSTALSQIESIFDISGTSSLGTQIGKLLSAFSAWSVYPKDATQRGNVIAAATQLAESFQQTSADLSRQADEIADQATVQVESVNRLAGQIRDLNHSILTNPATAKAGDAQMCALLEELSESVNITTLTGADGTKTVLLDGQVPLVVGETVYSIRSTLVPAGTGNAPPQISVRDASGQDITSMVTGGRLGGLISVRNGDIASLLGDATHRGSLNDLAFSLADRVNQILQAGVIDDTVTPATAGVALFQVSSDSTAAASLTLATGIDGSQLAAIDPGPPSVANGVAARLAALSQPTSSADKLNGFSFSDFYGNIAAEVGRNVSAAKTAETRSTQLVSQARSIRGDISGVSLNQEAAKLLEIQRSYEAASRIIVVLNDLMDNVIRLIP